MALPSKIVLDQPISIEDLIYFRSRSRDRLFQFVVREPNRQELAEQISIAELALRIGKGANEFDQLLATPDACWRLEDYVDAVLALYGAELDVRLMPVGSEIT